MKSVVVENKLFLVLLLVAFKFINEILSREFELGPCYLQFLEPCANNSIQFFLFTSDRPRDEPVLLDNIAPILPFEFNETVTKNFKMIIHGYGGHLDFNGSKQIRNGKSFVEPAKLLIRYFYFYIGQTCISCEISEAHIRKLSAWDLYFSVRDTLHLRVREKKAIATIYWSFNYQFARLLSLAFTSSTRRHKFITEKWRKVIFIIMADDWWWLSFL